LVLTGTEPVNVTFSSVVCQSFPPFGPVIYSDTFSSLASEVSVLFNSHLDKIDPAYKSKLPTFDCRVWNMPTKKEVSNYFIWRETDCERNSVAMLTRHYFSHKECINKTKEQMIHMLKNKEKPTNWEDLPKHWKRGTFYQRRKVKRESVKREFERKSLVGSKTKTREAAKAALS